MRDVRVPENLQAALLNLRVNKLRSALSTLGVTVGIAAVILTLSIGRGTLRAVEDSFDTLGVEMLFVVPAYSESLGRMGELAAGDVGIVSSVPAVESAAPYVKSTGVMRAAAGEYGGIVLGVDPSYAASRRMRLERGRPIMSLDMEQRAPVCLISEGVARAIFTGEDPVGRRVTYEGVVLTVIGVYRSAGGSVFSDNSELPDFLVPETTALRTLVRGKIPQLNVRLRRGAEREQAKAKIIAALEAGGRAGLYSVTDMRTLVAEKSKVSGLLMTTILSVASISLLVGGIGVMNVMLVSVAERTREVGIRKALGAKDRDILAQFLTDGCLVGGLGGIIGVILGVAAAWAVPLISHQRIATSLTAAAIVGPAVFSLFLGMLFSLFPAYKAARLSPLEALRYQ